MKRLIPILCCILLLCGCSTVKGKEPECERCAYEIEATLDPEERTLQATMQVTVPNRGKEPKSELKFQLWPNAYREGAAYSPVAENDERAVYYAGKSYGKIDILSVEGGEYSVGGQDENILTVSLSSPLAPKQSVSLCVKFQVTLPQANHRLGVGKHNITLTHFYPVLCYEREGFQEYVYAQQGDPFVNECADFRGKITFPQDYIAVCGAKSQTLAQGENKIICFNESNVRDLAFVFGKELKSYSQTLTLGKKQVTLEYFYLNDSAPEVVGDAMRESYAYFSQTYGELNRSYYAVAQTDFPCAGMEYSGLSLLSYSLIKKEMAAVVVHETAHQWWYSAVGSNQFEQPWQDEALAEYSTALCLGQFPDLGGSYQDCVRQSEEGYRAFFSVQSQLEDKYNVAMGRPLTEFKNAYEYRNLAYDKGVIMLDRTRTLIGEKKFTARMRKYFQTYQGKIATPEQFVECFAGAGGNVKGLMSSFLKGDCII